MKESKEERMRRRKDEKKKGLEEERMRRRKDEKKKG